MNKSNVDAPSAGLLLKIQVEALRSVMMLTVV